MQKPCVNCKNLFEDEGWKTMCPACYSKTMTDDKLIFERQKNKQISRLALINSAIEYLKFTRKKPYSLKESEIIEVAKKFEEWVRES